MSAAYSIVRKRNLTPHRAKKTAQAWKIISFAGITPNKIMPPLDDEIRLRIEAVKQRQAQPEPDVKQFEYAPDQPLHLLLEDGKTLSFYEISG